MSHAGSSEIRQRSGTNGAIWQTGPFPIREPEVDNLLSERHFEDSPGAAEVGTC